MHPIFNQTCQQWMAFMNHLGMCFRFQLFQMGWGWAFLPRALRTSPLNGTIHLLVLVTHPISPHTSPESHWSQGQHQH